MAVLHQKVVTFQPNEENCVIRSLAKHNGGCSKNLGKILFLFLDNQLYKLSLIIMRFSKRLLRRKIYIKF